MKILLTGIAGTGKSTIIQALNEQGITAIDLHDVPDLFSWQDKKTKETVPYIPVQSREWFEAVERLCDLEKLKDLIDKYEHVVMAGTAGNQTDIMKLFDKTILLQANPDILVERMKTRTNKSGYGKTQAEQEDNIEWQKSFDPFIISQGALPLNTEGGLDEVVNKIITDIL